MFVESRPGLQAETLRDLRRVARVDIEYQTLSRRLARVVRRLVHRRLTRQPVNPDPRTSSVIRSGAECCRDRERTRSRRSRVLGPCLCTRRKQSACHRRVPSPCCQVMLLASVASGKLSRMEDWRLRACYWSSAQYHCKRQLTSDCKPIRIKKIFF